MAFEDTKLNQEKVVKVGIGQISNPTPKGFKYVFRAYSFLAGLWAVLAPSLIHLTPETIAEINRYILIGGTVLHFSIKFFGLDVKDTNE